MRLLVTLALRNLLRHKRRTLLTAAALVMGIASSRTPRTTAGRSTAQLRGPSGARLGLKPGQPVILSPKILKPFYNVHLVVEAVPQVLAAFPEARLVITEYGADPDYKDQIKSRITALGLEVRVLFVGQIPHAEMPEYYSLADVSVAVPSSEGLPQTLLEGLGCEVPNILSRLPRYEEVVQHGQSAYFVDSTPEAIAAGVNHLLQDPELRQSLPRNGLSIVRQQGDFDREVSRVEDEYYELLARRKPVRFGLARALTVREVLRYFVSPLS